MLSHILTTNLRSEMRKYQLDLTTHSASTILNSRVPSISSSTFGVHRPCGCTPYIAMETGKAMETRMFPSLVQIVVRFVDCQTLRSLMLNTIDFFTVLHVIKWWQKSREVTTNAQEKKCLNVTYVIMHQRLKNSYLITSRLSITTHLDVIMWPVGSNVH